MIRRPPRSTLDRSSAASDVYKRQAFTNPNARCPVCGAPVYFYDSGYGGRVFFDELGPPWPKHPCTATQPPKELSRIDLVRLPGDQTATKTPNWLQQGWAPFACQVIESLTSSSRIVVLGGVHLGIHRTLFTTPADYAIHAPFQLRERDTQSYHLSTINISEGGELSVVEGVAYKAAHLVPSA